MLHIDYVGISSLRNCVKMVQKVSMNNEQPDYVQKFLPFPFSMLTIHLKSLPEYSMDGIHFHPLPKVYFNFGYFCEREVYMRFGREVESLIILFSPVCMCSLFNIPLKKVKGALFLPAEEYLKDRYAFVERLFNEEPTDDLLLESIAGMLPPEAVCTDYKIEISRKAIEIIYSHGGNIPLTSVAEECCVSLRTLERYFDTFLGITPGRYCQLVRFQKLLLEMERGGYVMKQLCSKGNFFDQSHMINNFKLLTGETPGSFKKERKNGLFHMEGLLHQGV